VAKGPRPVKSIELAFVASDWDVLAARGKAATDVFGARAAPIRSAGTRCRIWRRMGSFSAGDSATPKATPAVARPVTIKLTLRSSRQQRVTRDFGAILGR
jgi:hypothetical protein